MIKLIFLHRTNQLKKLYQLKILKLLNKKNLSIILSFFFFFTLKAYSTEPVDIWNIETNKITTENSTEEKSIQDENILNSSIYEMQLEKKKKKLKIIDKFFLFNNFKIFI